jgi:uncharacterized coiled-coil protein SlyX
LIPHQRSAGKEKLKSTIAQQQRAIEQLATQMQKVSARLQLNGVQAITANP